VLTTMPTDIAKQLFEHEVLHQKYKRFFMITIITLVLDVFFQMMLEIVKVSGGSAVALAVIYIIVLVICKIVLVIAIANIAFGWHICFSFERKTPDTPADELLLRDPVDEL
jgi:hypothetical protein